MFFTKKKKNVFHILNKIKVLLYVILRGKIWVLEGQ